MKFSLGKIYDLKRFVIFRQAFVGWLLAVWRKYAVSWRIEQVTMFALTSNYALLEKRKQSLRETSV